MPGIVISKASKSQLPLGWFPIGFITKQYGLHLSSESWSSEVGATSLNTQEKREKAFDPGDS